jgi:hypothetical protein
MNMKVNIAIVMGWAFFILSLTFAWRGQQDGFLANLVMAQVWGAAGYLKAG